MKILEKITMKDKNVKYYGDETYLDLINSNSNLVLK